MYQNSLPSFATDSDSASSSDSGLRARVKSASYSGRPLMNCTIISSLVFLRRRPAEMTEA